MQTAFSTDSIAPGVPRARCARAGGAPPNSVRRRRPPAHADRMGAWGQRAARVDEVLAGHQALQRDGQRLDSGLVDETQERPNEVHSLTEDDLPSTISRADVVLRAFEVCVRQHQHDPGPHRRSDEPRAVA